ncbi:hypothetical protein Mgra_00008763 [Meloidogyne graminicola]|uniref:SPRY domain-containing protein n=1 Tax=Meloidogyne graminicola TaxID=189291 RepID=A0A8S9ZEW0_9BILA|nr:hypothetical protein Mgra_00008763 [Meloidogyne graminicola]
MANIYSINSNKSSSSSSNSSLSIFSINDDEFEQLSTKSVSSENNCSIKEEMKNKLDQHNILLNQINIKMDKILNSQLFSDENKNLNILPNSVNSPQICTQQQLQLTLNNQNYLSPAPQLCDYNKMVIQQQTKINSELFNNFENKLNISSQQISECIKLNDENFLSPARQIDDLKINLPISAKHLSENLILNSVPNKWSKIIADWCCCKNNCQNLCLRGFCQKGNGIVRLQDNFAKYYLSTVKNGFNRSIKIITEKGFTPINNICCLYYFEVKNLAEVGLYLNNSKQYRLCTNGIYCSKTSLNSPYKQYLMFNHSIMPNDIIGCGIYFSNNKTILPKLFFTLNGKKLVRIIVLENSENISEYFPCVSLFCCSIEANFGANKFLYNIEEFKSKEFN